MEDEEDTERGRHRRAGPATKTSRSPSRAAAARAAPPTRPSAGRRSGSGAGSWRRSITDSATSAPARTRNAGSSQSAPMRAAVAPNRVAVPRASIQPDRVRGAATPARGTARRARGPSRGPGRWPRGAAGPTTRPSRRAPATSATSSQGPRHAAARLSRQGADSPVQSSNARAAWCTSIPRPLAAGTPRARAAAEERRSRPGGTRCRARTGPGAGRSGIEGRRARPCIPIGVALTTTSAASTAA